MNASWKIYVVNLARSSERWLRIHNHLDRFQLDHERVDAVDAQEFVSIPADYLVDRNKQCFFSPLKNSEIACYMSHLKALKQFLSNPDVAYAVILEDDVEFIKQPNAVIESIINQMDSSGVVKLYNKRNELCFGREQLQDEFSRVAPVRVPLGFQAQLWSRAAAHEFIEQCKKFYRPVDVDMQYKWQFYFSLTLVQPNLVRELSAEVGGSTISLVKSKISWKKIQLEIRRPLFRLKILCLSIVHSFVHRIR